MNLRSNDDLPRRLPKLFNASIPGLKSPQARGSILIGILLTIAGGEGREKEVHALVMDGRTGQAGAAELRAIVISSFLYNSCIYSTCSTCTLRIVITRIMHGMRDQYSGRGQATLEYSNLLME